MAGELDATLKDALRACVCLPEGRGPTTADQSYGLDNTEDIPAWRYIQIQSAGHGTVLIYF